jgi:hypothetical protein
VAEFLSYQTLRNISSEARAQVVFKSAGDVRNKTVFLSHSSADHDLVPAVALILENHGGRVYVDERDGQLGSDLFATAERLRSVVKACEKFVLLVTPRTKDSAWIPWELGLGDGEKRPHNVALFPSAESTYDKSWSEREYLGLYDRIVWGRFTGSARDELMVLKFRENSAVRLAEWLVR